MTDHSWFREYCEKSTFRFTLYFGMMQRSLVEKLFWILTFFLVIFLTFSAMSYVIHYWTNNPTAMFIENTESSIQEIPFPSITICPSDQLRNSVQEKYLKSNSSYRNNFLQYQSLICSSHLYAPNDDYHTLDDFNYETIKNLVNDCSISCTEMIQSAEIQWQNTTITNVCKYVQSALSAIGRCYVINMMPAYQMFNDLYYQRYKHFWAETNTFNLTERSKWNLDDGYISYSNDNILLDVIPFRASGVSYYHKLKFRLRSFDEDFLGCPNGLMNNYFVILFSNPGGFYSLQTRSFTLRDTDNKIQITPFVKKMNSNLKRQSLNVRKCYMHNERKLSLFQYYSQKNCDHECSINETITMCGCLRFEWAFLATKDEQICGPSKKECMTKALTIVNMPESIMECNCLPTCTEIHYEIKETSEKENWNSFGKAKSVNNTSRGATIEIIFKHPYFTAYQVKSLLNINSLISTLGGILGIFLGINLKNLFEIVYSLIEIISYKIKHGFCK